jgi:hypothetical protein
MFPYDAVTALGRVNHIAQKRLAWLDMRARHVRRCGAATYAKHYIASEKNHWGISRALIHRLSSRAECKARTPEKMKLSTNQFQRHTGHWDQDIQPWITCHTDLFWGPAMCQALCLVLHIGPALFSHHSVRILTLVHAGRIIENLQNTRKRDYC